MVRGCMSLLVSERPASWKDSFLSGKSRVFPYPLYWGQVLEQWIHLPVLTCSSPHCEIYKRIAQGEEDTWPWMAAYSSDKKSNWKFLGNVHEMKKILAIGPWISEANHYFSVFIDGTKI